MNSKQSNSCITPKRKTPTKRKSISGKENNEVIVSKISGKRVEQLVNDMRISACKTISNFKCSLGDLSNVKYLFISICCNYIKFYVLY